MTTPATDGAAVVSAGATSTALWTRVRERYGIGTAGASSVAVAEGMPRATGSLTTAEPDQLLDAYTDFALYGVFDGGFAKGPNGGPGVTLDPADATKQMKYWSGPTAVSGAAATAKQISDSQYPSGYALEISFAASASAEELRFEQTVPLAGSFARVVGGVARVSGKRTGGGGGISIATELAYMGADGTIYATDTQEATAGLTFIHTSDQALGTPDSRVRKVRIRISAKRDLAHAATVGTLVLSDVRFDRTTLFTTYADLFGSGDPWRVFNSFGSLGFHYQGDTIAGIDGEAPGVLGYSSLWTSYPLGLALQAAPSTPDSGWMAVYPKVDRKIYAKDDLGVETQLTNWTIGSDVEAWDADLDALAALGSTGVAVRTGTGTWTTRSIAVSGAGVSIANGSGVSGAPTLSLADDAAALEALSTTGLAARTALSTWTTRTLAAPAAGFTITNPAGIAGNPTFVLADDLDALESISTTGVAVRTGAGAWTTRSFGVTGAGLAWTNGSGVLGAPTISLIDDLAGLEALTGTGLAKRTGTSTWAIATVGTDYWGPGATVALGTDQLTASGSTWTIDDTAIQYRRDDAVTFGTWTYYSGAVATSGVFNYRKSRGATIGTNTAVAVSDELFTLNFQGFDGTNYRTAASIRGTADTGGTITSGSRLDGGLTFATHLNGTLTDAWSINRNGTLAYLEATANGGINTGTAQGMILATSAAQKLALWGTAPVVQPSGADQAALGFTAVPAGGTGTAAGGWDTAANRNTAITRINATIVLLNEVRRVLTLVGLWKGSA